MVKYTKETKFVSGAPPYDYHPTSKAGIMVPAFLWPCSLQIHVPYEVKEGVVLTYDNT